MPFKKRRKNQHHATVRQHKNIQKRLMEISIIVDNYIYRHKPITINEAKMYSQEIFLYKTQCNEDIRTLQVIEKLTRFMKSITEETKGQLMPNQNIDTNKKGESTDTAFKCQVNLELEENGMAKDNGQTNKCLITINTAPHITQTVSNIVNIASDNIAKRVNNTKRTRKLNKEIAKSPHEMDLKTVKCRVKTATSNSTKRTNESRTSITKSVSSQPSSQDMKSNHNIFTNDSKDVANDDKSTKTNNYSPSLDKIQKVNRKNVVKQKNNSDQQTKSQAPEKNKKRVAIKKTYKDILSDKKQGDIPKSNDVCYRKIINPQQKNSQDITPDQYQHKCVDIVNDEVSITAAWNKNDSLRKVVPDQGIAVSRQLDYSFHNKSVENDLSWVENIKYVREVSTNESDPKLESLDENFWVNFDLPPCWNDTDFL